MTTIRYPSFLGIGAQKAATTWLYEMLSLHPDIAFAQRPRKSLKEVHFWDGVNYHKGLDWYLSLFSKGKFRGEITPRYALLASDTIREIYRLNPALRILYTLRNPIERAWSAAQMKAGGGRAAIEGEPLYAFLRHADTTSRSDYASTLRAWRGVFPEPSLLVLRYEQIFEDRRKYLAACAGHIGADPGFYDSVPDEVLGQAFRAGTGIVMPRHVYEHLRELHRPHILDAQAVLGWDLSSWLSGYDEWREQAATRPSQH
jgi:hypothetical protein